VAGELRILNIKKNQNLPLIGDSMDARNIKENQ
jgi:hypothetical protein